MSGVIRFQDNPEKTTIVGNDIVAGTNSANGKDAKWKFSTILAWVRANVSDLLAGIPSSGSGFGAEAPEDPYVGQIWFDAAHGNKTMRWDGTQWVDVQAVLELGAFGTGIMPVLIRSTLPDVGSPGMVIFLQSDYKLYRWNGTGWTKEVDGAEVVGQIVADQIANASLTLAKFAAGLRPVEIVDTLPASGNTEGRTVVLTTNGKLYRYVGSAWTAAVAAADVTGTLTDAQIAAVAAAKITGTITSTQITDGSISTPKLAAGAVVTASLAAGAVTADNVAANAITAVKIDTGAVTTTKLAAGAVTTDTLGANVVTTAKLAVGAVKAEQIAAGEVTATHLAADSVTAEKLSANSVEAFHIKAGSVTTDKLAANVVTAGAIQAGSITADKIGTNQIIASAANIADGIITSAKIASLDAAKINVGNLGTVNISRAGRIYHPTYPTSDRFFASKEMATGYEDAHNWGTGSAFTFTHGAPVRMFGPGSGTSIPIFNLRPEDGKLPMEFFAKIIGYTGALCVYYRVSGSGSYIALAADTSDDGGNAKTSGRRLLSGINATDYIDFFVAPCDGSGNLSAGAITKRWELDVSTFNW